MRQLALMRIAIVLLVWAEWAGPLRPVHHLARLDVLAWTGVAYVASGFLLFGCFSRVSAAVLGGSMLVLTSWAGHVREHLVAVD